MVDANDTRSIITKIDLATLEVVSRSDEFYGESCLGHANDAAYNPYDKTIVVVDCTDQTTHNTIYILDAITLQMTNKVDVSNCGFDSAAQSITFDQISRQYITATKYYIYFFDENFNLNKRTSAPITDGYAVQGIDCDGRYIYRLAYHLDKTTEVITNHLVINDMNGRIVADIDLTIGVETENVVRYENKLYISCNNATWTGSELYTVTLTNIN